MFRKLDCRAGHYALLILVWAALCLPNLGGPSLWDIDEGNNSECAREMWRAGDWIIPTCNYQLRTDKPVLLYWLQMAAFTVFGAGEFAARLPSALAALSAVLTTYELGRRMFNAAAGLLAGLLLGGAVLFCAAAHFANPDALLNASCLLALFFFWKDYAAGRHGWSPWSAAAAGLAVLAKGPVGLLLPATVAFLFLAWRWQLRGLVSWRLLTSFLVFLLVAAPWYVWVTVVTKGAWTVGFWNKHNVGRFTGAMESHGGSYFYYVPILLLGCAPWCVFFALTAWYTLHKVWAAKPTIAANETPNGPGDRPALQFLLCWIAVYFVFFSAASTKLPNYILPLYPALALLTARFLDQWRRGEIRPPAWLIGASLACLALIGVGAAVGAMAVGGVLTLPGLRMRLMPGMEIYAVLAAPLMLGAAAAAWLLLRRSNRTGALIAVTASSLLFTALVAGWGAGAVEGWKAPQLLVRTLPSDQTRRDSRVATYAYFQPSLIFYCQREVVCLGSEQQVLDFLQGPLPSYLFIPADQWNAIEAKVRGPHRLLGKRRDLYQNRDVVVVTNE
jgi:4-amino-4-deoxy-L-arabinose transferase-like glycosyltransferase